jgi:hypothetical protein
MSIGLAKLCNAGSWFMSRDHVCLDPVSRMGLWEGRRQRVICDALRFSLQYGPRLGGLKNAVLSYARYHKRPYAGQQRS